MSVAGPCPDELETVSDYEYDQEGVPDRAEPIQPHQRRDEGDDRENSPAKAGDDAVRLAASSKIRQAIGAEGCEVQATGIQAGWTDCAADEKNTNRNWNCPAAP